MNKILRGAQEAVAYAKGICTEARRSHLNVSVIVSEKPLKTKFTPRPEN